MGRIDVDQRPLVEAEPEARERFCRRYEPVVRSYLAARWRLPPDHERISDASQEVGNQAAGD